ncbi:MAG: 3-oxoacyl-ACP reductase, partial [Lysobacterales bacterium CG_4_9_14_3_um_filter_62_6]
MTTTATILVTGASRGIGRAIALRLARDGFDIVVHCRNRIDDAANTAAAISEIGRVARVLRFDLMDRDDCARILLADVEANGAYYGVVC